MKIKAKNEAKKLAKAYSYNEDYKNKPIYILHCSRTGVYHVAANGQARMREQLIGYYINGIFTAEKSNS